MLKRASRKPPAPAADKATPSRRAATSQGTATAAPRGAARTSRSEATRTLMLDTAERLFALKGYDATGVRQIADEAGVNLGAIHYYWRTKDMLLRDALERRMLPLLQARGAGLDQVEAAGGGLDALLDASHAPSLLAGGATEQQAGAFRRFYGRMLFDPSPEVQAILAALLDKYALRFVGMLRKRTPDLSDNEFYWRVTFMYGAFLYAHTQHTRTTALWGGRFDQNDFAAASRFLTRFLEGGFQAPAADLPFAGDGAQATRRSRLTSPGPARKRQAGART